MDIKGRISIYDYDDNLLDSIHYYSREGRKNIMVTWTQEYRKNGRYFKIFPFALEREVPKPIKKKCIKKVIDDLPKEIVRPPATYNNLPIGFKYSTNGQK